MPHQNRVTPNGEIITTSARGMFMGNRGCLHDNSTLIKRPYKVKRWIICVLEFKGRQRAVMQPNKYTELFFLDEATALSAGHRPCAECQRERFKMFKAYWAQVHNVDEKSLRVDDIDNILHAQRLNAEKPRVAIDDLPDGVFISLDSDSTPFLVHDNHLFPWQPTGYGQAIARPHDVDVTLLTPLALVAVIQAGFTPIVRASVFTHKVDFMTNTADLRHSIREFLKLVQVNTPIDFTVQAYTHHEGYTRQRISYPAVDGDMIPAYLLIPDGDDETFPAVLVHHQHASQRHLGKSEVVGIAGNPLQAFAPELARHGFIVLAPDSICFEDRRKQADGIEPQDDDDLQHFIEMGERLTQGDTLMRKVLSDASVGLSLLAHHPQVDSDGIGICGHSYGGNTVLFQMALDTRIAFGVSSGALCSYAYKRAHDIALEMALIIPDFVTRWDLHHLLDCIAPRPLFIVSSDDDPFSKDAPDVIARTLSSAHVTHFRDKGKHALTQERFDSIVTFIGDISRRV